MKGMWFQTTDKLKGEEECNKTMESDPEKEFEDCFEKEGDVAYVHDIPKESTLKKTKATFPKVFYIFFAVKNKQLDISWTGSVIIKKQIKYLWTAAACKIWTSSICHVPSCRGQTMAL